MKSNTHTLRVSHVILPILFASVIVVRATGYFIDRNNPGSSDQNAGTFDLPWKTISKANKTLVAGDTVYIRAGTYNTYIAPDSSGTALNPIVYRNYATDSVIISDTSYGIRLSGKSYISITGINFYNLDKFLWLEDSASHNSISYCNFDQGRNIGWSGSKIYRGSSFNWLHHCRFSKYGKYTDDDIGCILDIGNEETREDFTGHNLVENNIMFHGGHHILGVYGMYNVIRNNYFHNEPWLIGTVDSDQGAILYGDRNLSVSGYPENSGRNLFEGNRIAYSSDPPDNIGASGMALNTGNNIVRFNRFYHNNRAGLSMSLTSTYYSDIVYNKVYNNTFLHNGINTQDPVDHMNSGIGFGIYSGSLVIKNNALKNNLLFGHRKPYDTYKVNLAEQIFAGNWDGDSLGDPVFVNASMVLGNPMDPVLPDLHLQPGSPCIDAATFLTTITSATGSGLSFQVDDAGYFIDGWGIDGVEGDEIRLYQDPQAAHITKIDYQTNTITVDRSITWTQNRGVCPVYRGSAPDAGAYEYMGTDINGEQNQKNAAYSVVRIFQNSSCSDMIIIQLDRPFLEGEDKCIRIYEPCGRLIMKRVVKDSNLYWNAPKKNGIYLLTALENRLFVVKRFVLVQ